MISLIAFVLGVTLVAAVVAIASFFVASAIGIRRLVLGILLFRSACDPVFGLLQSGSEMGPGAAVNALIIGLAFLVFVESPALIGSAILPMWGGFLMSAGVSVVISPDPMKAVRVFFELASYAAVFALPFGLIRSKERVLQCLLIVMYSSFIPVTYAFLELAIGSHGIEEGRLQSTFAHPNIFAFYIVILLALTLFMWRSNIVSLAPRVRSWFALYLPVIIVLIVFTKTRSAWIGAAIVIITSASIVNKRYLIFILLVPLAFYLPGVEERLFDLESGNINSQYPTLNSYDWRQLLWERTLDWLTANPSLLLGHGLASFRYYLSEFFYTAAAEGGTDPHNVYLQIFFEMGTFGLLTFLWVFVSVFVKLKEGYSVDKAGSIVIMALLFSYLIECFSDNVLDYLVFQWYFWFIMGVVCAWYRIVLAAQLVPRGEVVPLSETAG